MERPAWIRKVYGEALKFWNAILAGVSIVGIAIFSVIPPLERYLSFFIFLGANAVVWTVIEIKVKLETSLSATHQSTFPTMRAARRAIVLEITRQLKHSNRERPLKLVLIGGRMRSMGDIVREIADGMLGGEIRGYLDVEVFCMSPESIVERVLPGDIVAADQRARTLVLGIWPDLAQSLRRYGG